MKRKINNSAGSSQVDIGASLNENIVDKVLGN